MVDRCANEEQISTYNVQRLQELRIGAEIVIYTAAQRQSGKKDKMGVVGETGSFGIDCGPIGRTEDFHIGFEGGHCEWGQEPRIVTLYRYKSPRVIGCVLKL
jgi:hypothetical protein